MNGFKNVDRFNFNYFYLPCLLIVRSKNRALDFTSQETGDRTDL